MIDPRLDIVQKRLQAVRRIVVFASAKGGVGKSLCTAACALQLARGGRPTAVLDMDFQGASAHLFLGAELRLPEEQAGIRPLPVREHLQLMSFAAFSGERAVPLRGGGVSEAMLELLAITVWDPLDFLLVDMPPGIGDELLDLLRYVPRAEFVVIATPSPVAVAVVERLLGMLKALGAPVLGVVENMSRREPSSGGRARQRLQGAEDPVGALAARFGTCLLGRLPFVESVDTRLSGSLPADGSFGTALAGIVAGLGA